MQAKTEKKQILYFHSSIWCDFFSDLLFYYQKENNAKVVIVSSKANKSVYKKNIDAGAEHVGIPAWDDYVEKHLDADILNDISSYVQACEKKTNKAVSRIILASERNFGRAFSVGSYYWPNNALQSRALKQNEYPFLVVLSIFHFLKYQFEKYNPNLVLARSNNESLAMSAWFIAQNENIPYFTCRFSKIASKRAFWTDDYNMYNTRGFDLYKKKSAKQERATDKSLKIISAFRNNPKTIDYIQKNWQLADAKKWFKKHIGFLGLIKAKLKYFLQGSKGQRPKPVYAKLIEFYRIELIQRMHKKYFKKFSDNSLQKIRYIYMPMHKEPELMLNFESPLWHDQKHAMKFICSMLPMGYRLLVKEHRFNWGRRYTDYLKFLKQLPNVELINPFEAQFKYIRNADLIITDNGSTGWEGLLMNKPVITLEKTFYDAPNLVNKVMKPHELDAYFIKLLHNKESKKDDKHLESLGLFIDAEYDSTIPIKEMHQDIELSVKTINQLMEKNERYNS